jgi:hypothetical protein
MPRTEYVWNEANRKLSIHLSLDVVSQLGLSAMEAYKSVPRRGLEVGGLLLGHRENGSIYIQGFEPVESEHRTGPSYKLSDVDVIHLDEALARHPDAVGIYRTQTRDESLSLQEDDAELFRQHFTGQDDVYLLVQPATAKAAFFLPNDSLAPVHEFPFHASELDGKEDETADPVPLVPPTPAGVVPMPAPADLPVEEPPRNEPKRRSPFRFLIPVGAVLAGMVAGAALYDRFHQPGFVPVNAVAARPPASAPDRRPHVPLKVQRDGASIRLLWDRNSVAIPKGAKAILYINDGEHQSQLKLDPKEVRSGLVSYWPETDDVTFRLEVLAPDHTADGAIRVVRGVPVPVAAGPRQTPPASEPAAPPATVAAAPPASAPPPAAPPWTQGSAARSDAAESRPSPFTPTPNPTAPAPLQPIPTPLTAPAPAPAPASTRTAPDISVTAEPVGASRLSSVIGRIPLVRRLKKQRQAFVPPRPSHEYHPVLTASERRSLVRPVAMDVRVFVAENGKVSYAELLSNSGQHRDLATAAVYAARRWDFVPARIGNERVPGEVILHFRFWPDRPSDATQ